MGAVIQPLCPQCQHEVRGPHRLYGQQSYSCDHCRSWGRGKTDCAADAKRRPFTPLPTLIWM